MRIETGIDMVSISRIENKFHDNDELLHLIFTDREIENISCKAHKYQSIAGRWCAKEAFAKALGTGIGKTVSWRDIEILSDRKGKPIVHISESIRDCFEINSISLSISHTEDNAIAVIIVVFCG